MYDKLALDGAVIQMPRERRCDEPAGVVDRREEARVKREHRVLVEGCDAVRGCRRLGEGVHFRTACLG